MKYIFVVNATVSLGVEVEAGSLGEALDAAKAADVQSLCHRCSGPEPGEWGLSGEIDCGSPTECELVDASVDGQETVGDEFIALARRWEND